MARTSDSNTIGSSLTFSCGQGYTLTGPTTIACQTDGSWSGPVPSGIEGEGEVVCVEGKGEGLYIKFSQASVRYSEKEKEGSFPFLPLPYQMGSGKHLHTIVKHYAVCISNIHVHINIAEREDFKSWLCNVSNIEKMDCSDINCSSINSTCSLKECVYQVI